MTKLILQSARNVTMFCLSTLLNSGLLFTYIDDFESFPKLLNSMNNSHALSTAAAAGLIQMSDFHYCSRVFKAINMQRYLYCTLQYQRNM